MGYANKTVELTFKPRGTHMLECLAASAAAALKIGIDTEVVERQISLISDKISGQTVNKRNNFYILPDYYNASSESVKASLCLLASMDDFKYKSALIGTVKEAGAFAFDIHRELGRASALSKLRTLYFFGEFAAVMAESAIDAGMCPENIFVNTDESAPEITAMQILEHHIKDELILFKASNSTDLGRVVKLLEK